MHTCFCCLAFHADQAAQLAARFQNPIVAEKNEEVVLTEPFDEACPSNSHSPELDQMVAELRGDALARECLRELVHTYRTSEECLVHSDLHLGNMLVPGDGRSALYLIDWEFTRVGSWAVSA